MLNFVFPDADGVEAAVNADRELETRDAAAALLWPGQRQVDVEAMAGMLAVDDEHALVEGFVERRQVLCPGVRCGEQDESCEQASHEPPHFTMPRKPMPSTVTEPSPFTSASGAMQ